MIVKTYRTPTKNNGHVSTRMHKAATPKKCACCGNRIQTGELYIKKIGVHGGRFYSSHFHLGCHRWFSGSLMGLCNPYAALKAIL